jgi:beta-phosphoglucomutase family hydrolase
MTNDKAVLWDMDGVLVDTGAFHFETWKQALDGMGVEMDEALFRSTFGMNNRGVLTTVLGRPVDDALVEDVAGRKESAFRHIIRGRVTLLPGVRTALERLRAAGYRTAVASSAPVANIDALVDALDIRALFDELVSAAEMPGKPNPDVFLEAARRLGLPPSRCTVIEDAVVGVQAARSAGMRCIAVTNTNPREALASASLVVDSLEGLPLSAFDPQEPDGHQDRPA